MNLHELLQKVEEELNKCKADCQRCGRCTCDESLKHARLAGKELKRGDLETIKHAIEKAVDREKKGFYSF